MLSFIHLRRCAALLLCIFACTGLLMQARAQQPATDTLRLGLPDLEKRFVDSNLLILAAHYNVDAQKALVQQARLWDNPVLNTDNVVAANGKFLPYGKAADGSYNGQYFVQVQQLIKTAGKRGKLINLATTNAKISELQLQDLLRNLRFQLRSDYFTVAQQLGQYAIYAEQSQQLNRLLSGMQAQLGAGNIAQKDYLRIQSLLIDLQQQQAALERSIADNQAELRTLLRLKSNVFIAPPDKTEDASPAASLTAMELLFDTGKKNNAGYLLQQTQTIYQQQNVVYQKALRTPDVTLAPSFDRNSNYAPNYVGIGVSLPLPLFNKNQGNIRSAELGVKQQQSITANAETELYNNIANAYTKLQVAAKLNGAVQNDFYRKYEEMYQHVLQSYRQKQINLLEFLDFFNNYTESHARLLQRRLDLQLAKEELNFYAGADVVR